MNMDASKHVGEREDAKERELREQRIYDRVDTLAMEGPYVVPESLSGCEEEAFWLYQVLPGEVRDAMDERAAHPHLGQAPSW